MEGAGSTTLLPLLQQCITKLAPAATTIDIRNDCLQRINVSLRALQTILSITLIPNITTDLLGIRAIINTFRKLWNAELNRFENALLPANFVADAPTANAQNPGVSTVDFFNQTMSNLLRYLLFTEDDANYQYMTGETIAIPALNASKFTFIPTQNTARINGILNPASTANLNNTFSATFEFAQALMKQAATTNNLLTTALIRAGSAPDARETLAGKAKALADTALSQAQITALIAAHNTLKAQLERRTNVLLSLAEQGRVNFNTVSIDSANISAYLGNLGFALGTPIGIKITRAGIFVEAFGPLGLEQAYTTSTSIPNTSSIPNKLQESPYLASLNNLL